MFLAKSYCDIGNSQSSFYKRTTKRGCSNRKNVRPMKFTTIILGNKKRQVRLQSEVKYDPFHIFPSLQDVISNNNFYIDEGNVFYDFIGDQGPLRFVSDKFKNLLENNGVNGLSFIPIRIRGSKLQYFAFIEAQVDSRCEYDSDGDRIYGTFQIDFTSWNGEEIFYLKDSGATVCSLRVKELIEKKWYHKCIF